MHTGAGGVLCWFVGSVLWELVFDGPWPGTQEDRLQALWEHIVFTYGHLDSRSRLSRLNISMFYHGDKSFTCFTGKTGDTLELLFVLREICREFNDMTLGICTG